MWVNLEPTNCGFHSTHTTKGQTIMSIKIEVKRAEKSHRAIASKKTGAIVEFFEQTAWAHTLDRNGNPSEYPERINLTLEKTQDPYSAGYYTVDPGCFFVGDYDRLTLGKLKLKPLTAAANVPAKAAA
jgi:hypothetical protein